MNRSLISRQDFKPTDEPNEYTYELSESDDLSVQVELGGYRAYYFISGVEQEFPDYDKIYTTVEEALDTLINRWNDGTLQRGSTDG